MQVRDQNYSGSLDRDRSAILDRFARFMPVGFYYRTFRGPTRSAFLKFREPMIRKRTGLGRISLLSPHCDYDKAYRFCDVLVYDDATSQRCEECGGWAYTPMKWTPIEDLPAGASEWIGHDYLAEHARWHEASAALQDSALDR